jgi:exodeoxyribonuclease V alpha subunit
MSKAATLTGRLRVFLFTSGDFVIGILQTEDNEVTFKGNVSPEDQQRFLAATSPDDPRRPEFVIIGNWVTHPKYGKQISLSGYHEYHPASDKNISPAAMARFISGKVNGLGMIGATEIITKLGGVDKLVEVIANSPLDLQHLHSAITAKDAAIIGDNWKTEKAKVEVLSFFADLGITGVFPQRFWQKFGMSAIEVVKNDPYVLIDEIEGIGFKRADEIAKSLGITPRDPSRIKHGVLYVVKDLCEGRGNAFILEGELMAESAKILNLPRHYIIPQLEKLITDDEALIDDEGRVYLPAFYRVECELSEYILKKAEIKEVDEWEARR